MTLAPVTFGLDVPAWYQPLLEPYTRHKVRRGWCWSCSVFLAGRHALEVLVVPCTVVAAAVTVYPCGQACQWLPKPAHQQPMPPQVTSLSALSSREHLLSGQPRCFERAVLCNLVGIYASGGTESRHWWSELRPKTAGRRVRLVGSEVVNPFLVAGRMHVAACMLWHMADIGWWWPAF